jgi:hypothetical protein
MQATITYADLSRNVAAGQRAGRQHHQNHVVLLHFAKLLAKEKVRLAVQCRESGLVKSRLGDFLREVCLIARGGDKA